MRQDTNGHKGAHLDFPLWLANLPSNIIDEPQSWQQLSQWHDPPRTPNIAAVKTKRPMMTVSIQSTYSALTKLKKCWFWWVNMMTGDSPNTREPRYCQQWHPSNFNDWLISTRSTSGPKVTLTGPSCLERLQHHSTIELWNTYNNETCFTTSNLRMFHGNAGNEVGQFGTWKICVQQIGKWGKLIGCTICMWQTLTHLKINLSIIFFSN